MEFSELKEKVKNLKLEYKDRPQPELLIAIPNNYKNSSYLVTHQTEEFTSLCPLNPSQPDYASITIVIDPGDYLVELKSLKFFLVSFRSVLMFHEQIPPYIVDELVKLLNPRTVQVTGSFSTRGGLRTEVEAEYIRPIVEREG